jgi:Na+/H+ antiporter NhaA
VTVDLGMPVAPDPAPDADGPPSSRWTRSVGSPIRAYLRTEAGSAGVLLAAIVAALVWCNVDAASYEKVWETTLTVQLGSWDLTHAVREWVNSGLMTLFFLVVGLEARREFDLGDLRDRRRFLLPCVAGIVGMAVPVGIYLAVTHGGPGSGGWGIAMSTDTALALGLLVLVGRNVPDRVKIFLLSLFVVDDVVALAVVTVVYSDHLSVVPLVVAAVAVAALFVVRHFRVRLGWIYAGIGLVAWAALWVGGVDPIVLGLVMGLATTDYTPNRADLEHATGLFRDFREQPTAELARTAAVGVTRSLSPNARLQAMWLPTTSYVIVPLFGLANAGIELSGSFLADAFRSPITLGIVLGYVVGKPVAVITTSWVLEKVTSRRLRPDVGWAAVAGSGTIAGIGFTVSFVIAALALEGEDLAFAKVGVLSAGVLAAALTWVVYAATDRLPGLRKARALLGDTERMVDLLDDVDPRRDHIRGSADATVTLLEYGDHECPFCGQAEPTLRELMSDGDLAADLRYVWRHLPLPDVHPSAQLAAEAAEAASAQGRFWEMHDLLMGHQDRLRMTDLVAYAEQLGLDVELFRHKLKKHYYADRVAQDVASADLSGVAGTPSFFINGQRHHGAYDIGTLKAAIKEARVRAKLRETL